MEKFRVDTSKGMEFGLYSIGDHIMNPHTGIKISAEQRFQEFIDLAKLADEAGIDVFSVGESHQEHFTTQAHTVLLGAIAQATKTIKIASSATILSTSDPVRVYEDFTTLDLISKGRAEIVAGRASRVGVYHLLGYNLDDYEELFEEKMELLLKLNSEETITWEGKFRAPLNNARLYPRPERGPLPIWRAVGGHAASAIKAGYAGVPIAVAMLGGPSINFQHTIDSFREAAQQNGFDPATLPVATTGLFYTSENSQDALRELYPHLNVGFQALQGVGYPKQQFAQSADHRSALMVGSPQQIIEKILYQHELFGHQRYYAQMDFGGVPFDKLANNLELLATEIIPAVKKHTANQ